MTYTAWDEIFTSISTTERQIIENNYSIFFSYAFWNGKSEPGVVKYLESSKSGGDGCQS